MIENLCLGRAMASYTSSSEQFAEMLGLADVGVNSPFRARRASAGPPSSTTVRPPRLSAGDLKPLEFRETRLSWRSMFNAKATLPFSHVCIRLRSSAPMVSYCAIMLVLKSAKSSLSSKLLFDSSRRICILACKPRMPCESEFSFLSWDLNFSLAGFGLVARTGEGRVNSALNCQRHMDERSVNTNALLQSEWSSFSLPTRQSHMPRSP